MKKIQQTLYIFFFYCALFIPFPFHLFSFHNSSIQFIYKNIFFPFLQFIIPNDVLHNEISSDSIHLYFWISFILALSITTSFIISYTKVNTKRLLLICKTFLVYYLALLLLKYGLDKLFKSQFYLPEPNILFTPFGQLDKDILFWSTMGLSRPYNIFMGCLEVIPAILLFFRKTRIIGILISIPVLINIVAINLSFDISVKVYSILLLSIATLLASPHLKNIFHFFVQEKNISISSNISKPKHNSFSYFLKTGVIIIIICESFYPYVIHKNFNDDNFPRPILHGAYQVTSLQDSNNNDYDFIKRFFIHRDGYIIFQNQEDKMQDFKLETNISNKTFTITDYNSNIQQVPFNFNNKMLSFKFSIDTTSFSINGEYIPIKNLPALQQKFHWTIEGVE